MPRVCAAQLRQEGHQRLILRAPLPRPGHPLAWPVALRGPGGSQCPAFALPNVVKKAIAG